MLPRSGGNMRNRLKGTRCAGVCGGFPHSERVRDARHFPKAVVRALFSRAAGGRRGVGLQALLGDGLVPADERGRREPRAFHSPLPSRHHSVLPALVARASSPYRGDAQLSKFASQHFSLAIHPHESWALGGQLRHGVAPTAGSASCEGRDGSCLIGGR